MGSSYSVQARGTFWLQPNLADLVWLTLIYGDGFQATIHLCWLNPDKQRRLAVVGSELEFRLKNQTVKSSLIIRTHKKKT